MNIKPTSAAACAPASHLKSRVIRNRAEQIAVIPKENVVMELPVDIGDYTDFYSSKEHATNVGTMFRGADAALLFL